jgi:Mce-associated membrane protein
MTTKTSNNRKAQASDADAAVTAAESDETPEQQSGSGDDQQSHPATPSDSENEAAHSESRRRSRRISFSLRSLTVGVVIALLVAGLATMSWLYLGARHQLGAQAAESANARHAEKAALDYAVNAATMDFKDLQAWKVKLVQGTSPELNKKLSDAGTSMEQVLVPLQWSSSARPLAAKVRSSTGGVYVVDSFVSVQTKTIQSPDPLQSTATYSVTMDSNNNWVITDVGGIGSALEPK